MEIYYPFLNTGNPILDHRNKLQFAQFIETYGGTLGRQFKPGITLDVSLQGYFLRSQLFCD